MNKKEEIKNRFLIVEKMLEKTYINIEKYSKEELSTRSLYLKYYKTGVDCKDFLNCVKEDSSRTYSNKGTRYHSLVINNHKLAYVVIGREYHFNNEEDFKKSFREIDETLLDKIIEYVELKISINELVSFLSKKIENMLFDKNKNKKEFSLNKNKKKEELTRTNRSDRVKLDSNLSAKYKKPIKVEKDNGEYIYFKLGDLIKVRGIISYYDLSKQMNRTYTSVADKWIHEDALILAKVTREFYQDGFSYIHKLERNGSETNIALNLFEVIDNLSIEYQIALDETKHIKI